MLELEPLNGGLVTSRDPSLLNKGEVVQADNLMYRPAQPGLWKAHGRTQFNPTALGDAVTGLVFCSFDGEATDDLLIAQADEGYYYGTAGTAGTFELLEAVTEGNHLEALHYQNEYFLLNGANENRVLVAAGTTMAHGLNPITAPLETTVVETPGVHSWTEDVQDDGTVNKYYWYWMTEVCEYGDGLEIESTYSIETANPAMCLVLDDERKVEIIIPSRTNSEATGYRVYRGVSDYSYLCPFPDGTLIGDSPFGAGGGGGTFTDGGLETTGATLPGTAAASDHGTHHTIGGYYHSLPVTWVDPENAESNTDGDAAAYVSFNGTGNGLGHVYYFSQCLRLSAFGFTALVDPIQSLSVAVRGRQGDTGCWLSTYMRLSVDFGTTWSNPVYLGFSGASFATITKVLTSSELGISLTSLGMDDDAFLIDIYGVVTDTTNGLAFSVGLEIDSATVDVTSSGALGTDVPFPATEVTVGGMDFAVGRNGKAPIASTGDVFEDSLVINDVDTASLVRYSEAGLPYYFPDVYYLNFDTKYKDQVQVIRTLGNVLIVGLSSQVYRVSALPRATDSDFQRGQIVEVLDASHGVVGPMAAALFTAPDSALRLAYVSRYGWHLTDGFQVTTLTDDLDWSALVETSYLYKAQLINNPEFYELLLVYVPKGDTTCSKMLRASYHPTHLKDGGRLKLSGPCDVDIHCMTNATLDDSSQVLYSGSGDGRVYVENQGFVDARGLSLQAVAKTRDMYLAGQGGEWQANYLYLHHSIVRQSQIQVQFEVSKTGAEPRTGPTSFVAGLSRGLQLIGVGEGGEALSIRFELQDDGGDACLNYLVIDHKDTGRATVQL